MADDFDSLWGTAGAASTPAPTGTTVLDPTEFDKTWLSEGKSEPAKGVVPMPGATAAASGFISGIPIVGPYINEGVLKAAAKARSLRDNTKYEDELSFLRGTQSQVNAENPGLNTAGEVAGAVAPMVAGAGLAPRAFGLVGPIAERIGFGAGTNALISGADTAARGGSGQDVLGSGTLGAVVGGGIPVAGRTLGAVGNKLLGSSDAATNALVAKAEKLGISIPFSQTTSSPFVAKLSQMAGKLPGSGMDALHGEQQASFNRAVARTFGENTDSITPDVMANAKKRLGNEFETVARNSTIQFDQHLGTDLRDVLHEAGSALTESENNILHKQVGNILDKVTGAGAIEGPTYQALTRKGAPLDRAMSSSDPNVKHYAGRIKEALDDALERHAPPDMVDRLRTARGQYKAMKTVEDLVEKSPTGNISPALLMSPVRQSYGNMAYGGGGDLADLARVGQRFMKAPPDSGTPLGTAALNLLLGAGGAGVAGYSSNYDPISMLKGAALLPATALAARTATTLLNRPQVVNGLVQRAAPAVVPAYNQLSQQR